MSCIQVNLAPIEIGGEKREVSSVILVLLVDEGGRKRGYSKVWALHTVKLEEAGTSVRDPCLLSLRDRDTEEASLWIRTWPL